MQLNSFNRLAYQNKNLPTYSPTFGYSMYEVFNTKSELEHVLAKRFIHTRKHHEQGKR